MLVIFATLVSMVGIANGRCGYDSCPKIDEIKLNVHIVPHTHNDVGWVKTIDEYYYGLKRKMNDENVGLILDNVINELALDPKKKFIYVETAFFWMWWKEQDVKRQDLVKMLVENGQLEFVNGGWSMNDEAVTHYSAIIDQMTWGFKRLNDTFGKCARPRVAWNIDTFGHSKEQANILAAMGFDGFFVSRIDYQDKINRQKQKTMEMIWIASKKLPKRFSWLFTGVLDNHYLAPEGFCFDVTCSDPPIIDNPKFKDYNVDFIMSKFNETVFRQASHYLTNNVMLTMGGNFHYRNARKWFKNLDKLIYHINDKYGDTLNIFYSTPSCYLKALHDSKKLWPIKVDDFFPYADKSSSFWTGFYTSRPSLKRMIRFANNHMQVCKQIQAFSYIYTDSSRNNSQDEAVTSLREAMGIAQHHNAITGTSAQKVVDNYVQMLSIGMDKCSQVIHKGISSLFNIPEDKTEQFCLKLNVSQCLPTQQQTSFTINIYNPLSRPVSKYIRIPVNGSYEYTVMDDEGNRVFTQLVAIPKWILNIPGRQSSAEYELIMYVRNIDPFDLKSLFVNATKSEPSPNHDSIFPKRLDMSRGGMWIGNKLIQLYIDEFGLIQKLSSKPGRNISLNQMYGWYDDFSKVQHSQIPSGAYIFHPSSLNIQHFNTSKRNVEYISGPLVKEIWIEVDFWVSQVIRIYSEMKIPAVEVDWVVGPIPVDDKVGKEVVVRYSTNLQTHGRFYTDANGRQMMLRVRNHRPSWHLNVTDPISGNYYPVASRIFIQNEGQQFTVLTDRSQGGSSLHDGEMELMLHRRLLMDDMKGVQESLNEKAYGHGLISRGKHWLLLNSINNAATAHRFLAQELFMDVSISFSSLKKKSWNRTKRPLMNTSALPVNVHVLTFEKWDDKILIRFEHIFDFNEDLIYSKPVNFTITDLFPYLGIVRIREVTLGANLDLTNLKRFKWQNSVENRERKNLPNPPINYIDKLYRQASVTLNPMQIRTFILSVLSRKDNEIKRQRT